MASWARRRSASVWAPPACSAMAWAFSSRAARASFSSPIRRSISATRASCSSACLAKPPERLSASASSVCARSMFSRLWATVLSSTAAADSFSRIFSSSAAESARMRSASRSFSRIFSLYCSPSA